jgi:hypothetical protein
MKNKLYLKIMFIALAIGFLIGGCKNNEDDFTPTGRGSVKNKNVKDTSIVVTLNDTLRPPAGDNGSKTFYSGDTHVLYTGNEINANKSLSKNIAFAYNYNPDPVYGVSITNLDNFPYTPADWTRGYTSFASTALDAVAFGNVQSNDQLVAAWTAATPLNPAGAIYAASPGKVYAFKTEDEKHGLIKVVNVSPGGDPGVNYVVLDIKMQN